MINAFKDSFSGTCSYWDFAGAHFTCWKEWQTRANSKSFRKGVFGVLLSETLGKHFRNQFKLAALQALQQRNPLWFIYVVREHYKKELPEHCCQWMTNNETEDWFDQRKCKQMTPFGESAKSSAASEQNPINQTLEIEQLDPGWFALLSGQWLWAILLASDLHCTSELRITCQTYAMLALTKLSNCDSSILDINGPTYAEQSFH